MAPNYSQLPIVQEYNGQLLSHKSQIANDLMNELFKCQDGNYHAKIMEAFNKLTAVDQHVIQDVCSKNHNLGERLK